MTAILVGTVILWALSAIFIAPLSTALLASQLSRPAYAHLDASELSPDDEYTRDSLATRCHVMTSVVVLGVAGLIAGLNGFYFLAFSRKAVDWPGVIAFVASSFLGLAVRPGLFGM